MGSQALMHLLDPFLSLSLLRQCPAAQYSTERHPERKSLFHGETDRGFGTLLGSTPLAAELMEHGSKGQDKTQAKGVRTLLRQRHRLLALRPPLLRKAKYPQWQSGKAVTYHTRVFPIEECSSAMLLEVVEGYPLCQMRVR